jgi:CHAT domain-containing protein
LPDTRETLDLLAVTALAEASKVADAIGDLRAASYAWGYEGKLYEEAGKVEDALQLTRQAIFAAQQANALESLYLWQWQSGRLLKRQQDVEAALAAYQRAVFTLQSIRQALLLRAADPHFSFQESVEPVYFELVDLLLQRAALGQDSEQRRKDLLEARKTVELLKVAELRDYFQDECVDAARAKTEDIDKVVTGTTAVIYPIPLPDRLELLLTLPGGQLKSVTAPVKREALTEQVRKFRDTVVLRSRLDYRPYARQLYDWLIRPLEPDLTAAHVDTLVFVPHGALRTIPMAALSPDGVEFLISKYAIAVTPGLTLTDPQPLRRDEVKLLAGGLTEAVQNFPPLQYVGTELQDLQRLYGGKPLLNRDFAIAPVEQALRQTPFSIMHFATHGQFSGDPHETFILTYDERLTLDRLRQLVGITEFRKNPLELLTLSACETAAGDDRAALGLAGVAVKAGARSALATLWNINDEAAVTLVAEFYRQLQDPSVSRAVALQRAQLKLLHDQRFLVRHPGTWSQFLLINNWL